MELLPFLQTVSLILVALVTLLFVYQAFYLWIPLLRRKKQGTVEKYTRFAVLIAARNEELVLPHLLDSIRSQDYPADHIDMFVVADNCTDNTAKVAEEHGATVYQRFNKQVVGKGHALHYLLDKIQCHCGWEKYDAFLVFDADNLLEPDYFRNISTLPAQGYQAFCGYRNTKNFGTNWLTSGYGLWYLHESGHMNLSRSMMKTGGHVNGTGFGFTSQLLEKMGGWNFFTLTEDIEFNNYCATNGIKIGYCYDAVLYDEQPLTFSQSWKQRTRWAKGGIQVSFKYVRNVLRGLFQGGWGSYTCYELLSLSFWGFGLGGLTSVVTTLTAYLSLPPILFLILSVISTLLAYFSMAFVGLLTVIYEWRRIRATTREKILSVFTYPLFVVTFVPITLCAIFSKNKWEPIAHTVAISTADLLK